MYTNFLVPFDGSKSSCVAVDAAMAMRSTADVNVTVLQVQRMNDTEHTTFDVAASLAKLAVGDEVGAEHTTANTRATQEFVQKYFDSLPENVNLNIVVQRGNPADVICDYAKDNDIDCIVMGRRGLGGIRAVLGSVSTAVLRGTDLPVLVVK